MSYLLGLSLTAIIIGFIFLKFFSSIQFIEYLKDINLKYFFFKKKIIVIAKKY